jgi:hypothetical protein
MSFIRHVVSKKGILIDPIKIKVVVNRERPSSDQETQFPRVSQILSEVHGGIFQTIWSFDLSNKEERTI